MSAPEKPTTGELLRAIGDLSVVFSGLELDLIECLSLLVNKSHPLVGKIVADRLSFQNTAQLISDLVSVRCSAAAVDDFKNLFSELKAVAKNRNDILHSNWVFAMEGGNGGVDVIQERPRHRKCEDDPLYDAVEIHKKFRDSARQTFVVAMKVNDFIRKHLQK